MIVDVYDLNDSKNYLWRERFEKYRYEVMLRSGVRSENYTRKRFNIDEQLGSFLMIDREKDQIAAICSVFRPSHWPVNIARMFNRSYVDPNYRAKGMSRSDGVTKIAGDGKLGKWCQTFAYPHMIQVCVQNNIDLGVCTRENNGKLNAINLFLTSARDADPQWEIEENYYLTCPAPDSSQCWQRLIYVSLTDKNPKTILSQIPQITQEEYASRY